MAVKGESRREDVVVTDETLVRAPATRMHPAS
jgi:hypothetical protein